MTKVSVHGVCEHGFEELQNLFSWHLESGKDENAQLCVYVDGACVVDLWGSSTTGNFTYGPDLLHMIFSSGKSVAAIVMAMQVDRGLISYTDEVSKHWPDFAKNGKSEITIADVLRHEAGLNNLAKPLEKTACLRPNLKANVVGQIIEDSTPSFPNAINPGDGSKSRRGYHYVTRGFVLNEIMRRVDPKGRTIGQFIREELKGCEDSIICGLDESQLVRLAPQREASTRWSLVQSVFGQKTCMSGKQVARATPNLLSMGSKVMSHTSKWYTDTAGSRPGRSLPYFGQEVVRMCEMPSANMHANARGLAKLASIMANKGQTLMSEETWSVMHANSKTAMDAELRARTRFTQGGVNNFTLEFKTPSTGIEALDHGEREGFFGWHGYGGSVFQWHPELKIGFAYCPSLLQPMDTFNLRGAKLQKVTVDCVRKLRQVSG